MHSTPPNLWLDPNNHDSVVAILLKELDTDDAFVMELRDSIRMFDEVVKDDMGK